MPIDACSKWCSSETACTGLGGTGNPSHTYTYFHKSSNKVTLHVGFLHLRVGLLYTQNPLHLTKRERIQVRRPTSVSELLNQLRPDTRRHIKLPYLPHLPRPKMTCQCHSHILRLFLFFGIT